MPNFIDETGKRFGHWAVLKYMGSRQWLCLCDCGKEVLVDGATLRNGRSTSCGCYRKNNLTHGMRTAPEWVTWNCMKQRCRNPKSRDYKNYGGRGIIICERWRSFENFYADMGPRPFPNYTIDRRDNDGPYAPDNCRWVDWKTQQRNRRSNRHITYDGQTRTLAEWSEVTGVDAETIAWRIKHGRTIKSALGF